MDNVDKMTAMRVRRQVLQKDIPIRVDPKHTKAREKKYIFNINKVNIVIETG